MQQTINRGQGAARQVAAPAGCVAQGATRMKMRGTAAAACLCGALLLAGCGGGGGGDAALATAVPQSGQAAGTQPSTTSTGTTTATTTTAQPAATSTTTNTAPTAPSSARPDGYAADGTLPPPTPTATGPRSQNARGMTRALIDEWNATCTAQPTCQIDQAQIDTYNRDVCDAFYPDDPGCYIGQ